MRRRSITEIRGEKRVEGREGEKVRRGGEGRR